MHAHLAAGLALAALIGIGTAAHAQGLAGQSVQVQRFFPTQTTFNRDLGTQTVASSGTTYVETNSSGPNVNVLVNSGQIVFTFDQDLTFTPADFNGYQIAEVGTSPVVITGVTLDPASNLPGVTASDITFDASDIFANFQNLSRTAGQNVTLDYTTSPTAVPEPSATAAFAVGALGLAGLLLRARRKPASA